MTIATNPDTGETVFLDADGAWKPAQTAVNPQTKEMLAFDGKGWAAVPAKSKGILGYIDDAVRSLASGVTFGYADEISAKLDELTGRGGSYEENIQRERARDAQIPGAISIPGQVAGAIGSTIAAAPVAGLAAGTRVAQAASRIPQVLRFAGLGAAEGALAGSGEATEGNRIEGAAGGAAIGAPLGAVAPYVVRGASKVASGVRNAVSPQANVSADLARAIGRDADTPGSLLQRATDLSATRPGVATLADAGGENVRGLVERVAQTPGAGRTQVVPALTQRQQAQANRVSNDLRSLTGTNRSAIEAIEETMTARKTAAEPLYKKAYEYDIANATATSPERELANTIATDAFMKEIQTGWGKAIINSKEMQKTLQTEYGITVPGPQHVMAVIDAWKKTADDMIGEALGSNKSRVIKQMLDRVIPLVDEVNPAYAEARRAWGGHSKYLEAIDDGRNIFKTPADEFSAKFQSAGDAGQEAQRIGAVSAIVARMGNDAAKLGDMTKYLRSPEMRAKISALMPTPEAKAAWAKRLDFEVSSSELTGRALGNSATARRLAERQDAENLAGDLVMDAITGAPQSIIRKVIMAGPKWLRDTLRSRADSLLADVLTNPQKMQDLPNVLNRAASSGQPPSGLTNAAATVGGVELANQ
jgi:hypothetical protein